MDRRQSNIRPVRGITADTVRALIGLRHAGSNCSYLPLERMRLADEVKGSLPAPCIDPTDVPATLRDDCDAFPSGASVKWQGVGDARVWPTHKLAPDIDDPFWNTEPPKLRTVMRCIPPIPYVAQPAPSADCSDEARSAGPTEPTAPANSKRERLSSLAADPLALRREALDRAIRFLKTKCVLVDVSDRTALVRKYRVTGQRYLMLAEHVIEHAQALGMENG